ILDPEHCLGAAAKRPWAWPTWIGGHEGHITGAPNAVILVAQNDPLNELACRRFRDGGFDLSGVAGRAAAEVLDCSPDQRRSRVEDLRRRGLLLGRIGTGTVGSRSADRARTNRRQGCR